MSDAALGHDTTAGERVFGERYAVAPDAVLRAPVSCHAKLLWLAYQRHADPNGRCFPSHKRVAAEYMNGVSVKTVQRAKGELIAAGLISVEQRFAPEDNNRRTSDYVTLLRPKRTFGYGQKRYPTLGIENVHISSTHKELTPLPPTNEDGEHGRARRLAPRLRGDDRSGEHAPIATRRENQSPNKQPEEPRPLLYADRAGDPTVIHTTDGDYPYVVPLEPAAATPDERQRAIDALRLIRAR